MSYTNADLELAVNLSSCLGDVLKHLGLVASGASYDLIWKRILACELNVSHWGKRKTAGATRSLVDYLVKDGPEIKGNRLKAMLLEQQLITNTCSRSGCGIDTWHNKPLVLQLDHINGDRFDNRLENLRLLCPNCHTQTETHSGRNVKQYSAHRTEKLEELRKQHRVVHDNQEVYTPYVQPTKINWPEKEELARLVWEKPLSRLGPDLGVSDNAIRKRCKLYGIPFPSQGYWLMNDINKARVKPVI